MTLAAITTNALTLLAQGRRFSTGILIFTSYKTDRRLVSRSREFDKKPEVGYKTETVHIKTEELCDRYTCHRVIHQN